MVATSLIPQIAVPIAAAILGALLFHFFAKSRDARASRRGQYLQAYDVARDGLDQYLEWLVRVRYLVDPFDRRRLGREDPAKRTDASWYVTEIDELEKTRESGRRMVKSLEEAKYHLQLIDDSFLATLHALVEGVLGHWCTLMLSRPAERQNGVDTLTWILSRDSLRSGELEAGEVFRAETIVNDLSNHLRLDHNRRVHGQKAVGDSGHAGPLSERDGHLVLDGPLPFQSPEYLAAKDLPPWERQAEAEPRSP